jgi:hypothetical protein
MGECVGGSLGFEETALSNGQSDSAHCKVTTFPRPSWTAGNHAGSRTGDESKGKQVKIGQLFQTGLGNVMSAGRQLVGKVTGAVQRAAMATCAFALLLLGIVQRNAFLFIAAAAFLVFGASEALAQSSPTLPDVSTTMDTVKGLAYTAITIAVAIVGVKMGIKFVKWIRG